MAWKCVFCENVYFDKNVATENCGDCLVEVNNEKYWKCKDCGEVYET